MGDAQPSITVSGYLSLDTIVCPRGTFEDVPGGAALYAALGARAAGASVHLRACLCRDFPRAVLDSLAALGIDLRGLEPAPGRTRRARLEDRDASRRGPTRRSSPHFSHAGWWKRTRELAPAPPRLRADAVVITAMPADTLAVHAETARALGARVVVDTSEAFAEAEPEALLAVLSRIDLFAPSREEIRLLLPGVSDEAARRDLESRCSHLVQKRGPDGLWWSSAGQAPFLQESRADTIVDSTGAGDAAVGALAAGFSREAAVPDILLESSEIAARAVAGVGPSGLGLDLPGARSD